MKIKNLKGRPQRHKDGNRFKFKSFNTRVAEVSVDSRTQLSGSAWKPTGDECYFFEAYTKWTDLNRTQHFTDFQKDVRGKIQSFPLVLHHKDTIVDILIKHLSVPGSLALEPLLDLVVNLAKDLQKDFFPFFDPLFRTFIDHLFSSQDPEVLEWTFSCLSQLFHIQRRQMMLHLQLVFEMMIPLFEEGQKGFIVRFATESFAFLIRDFKDYPEIVRFLLSYCKRKPALAAGIGELLFETVKNVNHHLHSSFDKIFPVILTEIRSVKFEHDETVEICLGSMTDFLRNHLTKETSSVFWNVFLKTLEDGQLPASHYHCLVLQKFTDFKDGWLVSDPGRTMAAVAAYLTSGDRVPGPKASELMAQAAAGLLQSSLFEFDMKLAIRMKLIKSVFASGMTTDSKFQFARTLLELPQYQTEVLPSLLTFCIGQYQTDIESVLVGLISVLLYKDPEQFSSADISSWNPLRLEFTGLDSDLVDLFLRRIGDEAALVNLSTHDSWLYAWSLAVLAPHIRPKVSPAVMSSISSSLNRAAEAMQNIDVEARLRRILAQVLHASAVSLTALKCSSLECGRLVNSLVPCLRQSATDVNLLSTLEVALTNESEKLTLPPNVTEALLLNLRNQSHAVRRTTLRILDRCNLPSQRSAESESVFQVCLLAELVEPSVRDYREKLRFLRMLDHSQLDRLQTDPSVPLLYLFGCLKIGFSLLWKEIKQLIATYRPVLGKEEVWSQVEAELRLVSKEAEVAGVGAAAEATNGRLGALLDSQHDDLSRSDSNPLNAHKYRIHLWQTFGEIVGGDTVRNRIFSELFQRFMRNEFLPATLLGSAQDQMGEQVPVAEGALKSTKKSRAEAEDTVCAMLELLSKLHNPAALHQDPAVRGYLFDLLTYRTAKVQTAILKLLFNYKLEYIRPYEEQLMKLLDEAEMWNTLAEIEFGAATPAIQECHRPQLVPMIIRILFGRMQAKNKSRNTEKAAPRGRKEAIVRSLANCRPEEFKVFLDLALKPCNAVLEGSFEETIDGILTNAKLPTMNLKLADGVLQTLLVILDELRTGADHSVHIVFRTVVSILAVVGGERRIVNCPAADEEMEEEETEENHAATGTGLLKKLRKECFKCLAKLCSVFPITTLSEVEKKILFDVAVWPELESVIRDGPFAVTPLMRLILTWSQHSAYHDLLAVTSSDPTRSPLAVIIAVLNPEFNSNQLSVKLAVEVVDHLLNPQMLVEETDMPVATVYWTPEKREKVLGPFTGVILKYLHEKLSAYLARKKRKHSPLTESELRIASGISGPSLDSADSVALLDLLLPLLETSDIRKQSDLRGLLEIVRNLVVRVPLEALNGKVRALAALLSKDFPREARATIAEVFQVLADRVATDDMKSLAETVASILSWNPKYVEEPDYDRRGTAYKVASEKIAKSDAGEGSVNFALAILHLADYDIRNATDILSGSMRDMALINMIAVIRRFSGTSDSGLVLARLTPLVKQGLKSTLDAVRIVYVAVLGEIVDFYRTHALFRELVFLHYPANRKAVNAERCRYCNGEGILPDEAAHLQDDTQGRARCRCYNVDLDVFENLRHMQKHRVGGALHDLAKWCADGTIPVSTVLQYFLPFATAHLCNDQYVGDKYQGVINAVIELVQAVASQLTWPKYEPLLKHFLSLMTRKPVYSKQLIRVVVAIVDAFHFDLSGVDVKNARLQKAPAGKSESDPALGEMVEEVKEGEEDMEVDEAPAAVPAVGGPAIDQTAPARAEKIYRSLTLFMIPGLSKLITDKSESDNSHKLTANVHAAEKEEILRAPVALAIVKLLQKLPVQVLRRQIPGVFLKIARMLKSRLLSVRQSTRDTLSEIMLSLGPSYLVTLIKELRGVLKRGYQIHVLVHCVHTVLSKLLPVVKAGDLDRCVGEMVLICHEEMFGELAEEKEVNELTRKIAEARNIKSYDTYAILAKFASPGVLVKLIKPLKEKAEETQSHKVAVKLEKAFRQILTGLLRNDQLSEKDLLLFAYALYDHSTGLFGDPKPKQAVVTAPSHLDRPDSFLIAREPGRGGPAAVTSRKTNDYLVQDFGLQILLSCFKNSRLQTDNLEHTDMLDPFVPVVVHCLTSRHMSVKTTALRCLIWMLKFKLPSLDAAMEGVVKTLFVHLKNYSGPGAAVSENAEFVNAVYKALSSTVRDATAGKISDKHLKVLLTYAESDLREGTKQILAFNLLKAVLSRHLLTPELREIMLNLAKTSIQGEEENVRQQSRHLVYLFMTTYNPKKIKVREFTELYKDNLEYSLEHGRLVCVTMLSDLLGAGRMGAGFNEDNALPFFQLFAARLSDESSGVRHKAAESISGILGKAVGSELMEQIFKWTQRWLLDEDIAVKRIGFQTATLFAQVEKVKLIPRLKLILTALGKVIRVTEFLTSESAMLDYDHLLINALSLLANIIDHCGSEIWTVETAVKKLKFIFDGVRDLLLHEHEWVRIRSLEVYWRVFQQQPPQRLAENVLLAENPHKKLSLLAGALINQLKSYSDRDDYYELWSKCVLYVAQAVSCFLNAPGVVTDDVGDEKEEDELEEDEVKKEEEEGENGGAVQVPANRLINSPFVVRGVCREAVFEAVHEPKRTTKRLQVMKWIHCLCAAFDREAFLQFLPSVLQVLYRCTNEPSAQNDGELKRLTEEVTGAVEAHVGREIYADAMRTVILQFSKKRAERKRQQAVEPILNPAKAARMKIKKHLTRKEAKKRKTQDRDLELGRLKNVHILASCPGRSPFSTESQQIVTTDSEIPDAGFDSLPPEMLVKIFVKWDAVQRVQLQRVCPAGTVSSPVRYSETSA
ncbi:Small subunit processome component 20-like protein [Hypsibius exemplaris]|uniref:Small subunit processome component 20-like protein n=1 Tax=Hypsibius exemplaris TaxID=2072580 RepID=A0A1W0WJD8_HYPEX|nr:Small subunit processome component 20-like protein [Hypsibius exemplaris]